MNPDPRTMVMQIYIVPLCLGIWAPVMRSMRQKSENIFKLSLIYAAVISVVVLIPARLIGLFLWGEFNMAARSASSLIAICISILAYAVIATCNFEMKKRNRNGAIMHARIDGFKNFLETAEKDRLEKLVKENPKYFSDILPYTYALDVSETWVKQFEDIAYTPPEWYVDSSGASFDAVTFTSFMTKSMSDISDAMTYSHVESSSSGSDFSGGGGGSSSGGSSGGGGGGGGSSSW